MVRITDGARGAASTTLGRVDSRELRAFVRWCIDRRGMTMADAAESVGGDAPYLTTILARETLSWPALERVARACGFDDVASFADELRRVSGELLPRL